MIKSCCKCFVFFVNTIGVLIGLLVFVYGLAYANLTEVLAVFKVIDDPELGNATAAAHVITGFSIVTIAILGCILASTTGKGNRLLVAIMVLIALEMGTATYLLARKNKMTRNVVTGLDNSVRKYPNATMETDDPTTAIIDSMQRLFGCCGVRGPDDWKRTHPSIYGSKNLPPSCCPITKERFAEAQKQNSMDKLTCNEEEAFKDPCGPPLEKMIYMMLTVMIYAITIVAGFQLVMLGIALWISR